MVCGICGQFNFRQVPLEAAPWETLVDAMWRRGPDDRGLWHDSRCLLGSRRLSILDPSQAGHQPMRTADGRQVLVWNGELYNFRQLRRELQGLGHRFRSQSDSEVALEALRRWGTEALDR
ncbi:MAG: asparagine synthetase B, partial [Acidobacteriota bacterium]